MDLNKFNQKSDVARISDLGSATLIVNTNESREIAEGARKTVSGNLRAHFGSLNPRPEGATHRKEARI
jgi:hypothetical protein